MNTVLSDVIKLVQFRAQSTQIRKASNNSCLLVLEMALIGVPWAQNKKHIAIDRVVPAATLIESCRTIACPSLVDDRNVKT